ncbi:MAG: FHA domain-containing protein, partial [Planctomycetota bacterium]
CLTCKRMLRIVASDSAPQAGDVRGRLVIHQGPNRVGEQLFLAGRLPIEVGKLPGNDLLLQGQTVSRTHCRLIPTETGWRIEDQDSTNGLFVNGQRVPEFELQHGDRIHIGDYELRYSIPASGRRPTATTSAEPG